MDLLLGKDEWKIVEEGFHPSQNRVVESLFSLGNGHMGFRGYFEETYSGDSLRGQYIGGIYYPEPVRLSHPRKGLPASTMRRPIAADTLGIHVEFDGEALDLAHCKLKAFRRLLHLREGYLERRFRARLQSGKEVRVQVRRFCSMADPEIAVVRYAILPLNFSGTLTLTPYIDLNAANDNTKGNSYPWVEVETQVRRTHAYLVAETRETEFQVCAGMKFALERGGTPLDLNAYRITREKYVACSIDLSCREEEEIVLYKYVANLSSLHHPKEGLLERCKRHVKGIAKQGYEVLFKAHRAAWAERWAAADIVVDGDAAVQQGLRFQLFHLFQAYRGDDPRLELSPKAYTGEGYGAGAYWSAELFGLPFYMAAAGAGVARTLLEYRYRQLPAAIANAQKLGFGQGAALFPMVTINGEESCIDWELALESLHRNGAIAYAIFYYVTHSGDRSFLLEMGLELLIAICRFWAQRVHFSEKKARYVLHGVTGPNEFENNVNNNWYTNYLMSWCLRYTMEVWRRARESHPAALEELAGRIRFYEYTETRQWQKIVDALYLPADPDREIFLQQDGFLDKLLEPASQLPQEERPLKRHWSWDRILRSAYLQRADVLQGFFLFPGHFDEACLRRNYEFYEPLTVHESALSPPIHAVLAARLGKLDEAYTYLRQSVRLDLENLDGDTAEGCHVTSMGGAWQVFACGLAGYRIVDERPAFDPVLPHHWKSYRLTLRFRSWQLRFAVDRKGMELTNHSKTPLAVTLQGKVHQVSGGGKVNISFAHHKKIVNKK